MTAPIGILGGMGPEATILLQRRLLDAVAAEDDADHVPLLIDMNPQVPSRIARLIEGKGADPEPVLIGMARRLEDMGVCALAMPCNTAHHYADAIARAVSIPFLHMPRLAAARAAGLAPAGSGVGILASPATLRIGLFRDALAPHGLVPLYPDGGDRLLASIRRIKTGRHDARDAAVLRQAAAETAAAGARCILVGCSEFSLIRDAAEGYVPVLDTLDVLVDAILDVAGISARARPTGPLDRSA